jgi:serine/threonine-protein kinase
MGTVYRAYDPAIDRELAIKLVHTDLLHDEERANYMALFRREVQAAGRCTHPNIVTIHDFSDAGDAPFIVMELVAGENLQAVLRRETRLPEARALRIIRQVLQGLAFAHRNHVVHRDVKPANIIVQPGDAIKITDFGVARLGGSQATQTGLAIGTPSYMSPEQLSGGPIDQRADLFSAGAVLYEMLAGAKAFPGRDATEAMAGVLNRDPPDPATLGVPLPGALTSALRRALTKRPADRFQSAEEFLRALEFAGGSPEASGDATDATRRVAATRPLPSPDATTIASAPSAATVWDPRLLDGVQAELARHVGPVARVLVKQAAAAASDVTQLYETLARSIDQPAERTRFLSQAPKAVQAPARPAAAAGATSLGSVGLIPEQIAAAESALAFHVGPIARVLVKQAARDATSNRDFYERLVRHIDREDDRAAFRRKLSRDWGPGFTRS